MFGPGVLGMNIPTLDPTFDEDAVACVPKKVNEKRRIVTDIRISLGSLYFIIQVQDFGL